MLSSSDTSRKTVDSILIICKLTYDTTLFGDKELTDMANQHRVLAAQEFRFLTTKFITSVYHFSEVIVLLCRFAPSMGRSLTSCSIQPSINFSCS